MSSKYAEVVTNVDSNCELDDSEFEAFFVKKFKKMWKNKKNNLKKDFQNNKAPNKSKFV